MRNYKVVYLCSRVVEDFDYLKVDEVYNPRPGIQFIIPIDATLDGL